MDKIFSVTPISKREHVGSNRHGRVTSVPGEVMEQIILETISQHKGQEDDWQ